MLKVSNKELLELMKAKKIVGKIEEDEKKENKREEAFRLQLLSSISNVVSALNKESASTDTAGVVSAIKEVAGIQMEMCKMMQKPVKPATWTFSVSRDPYGNITSIEATNGNN